MRRAATLAASVAVFALAGCFGKSYEETNGSPFASSPAEPGEEALQEQRSEIISILQSRESLLPQGSPFDTVADAVMAANARAAEAELRSALLRSKAADKNWLPQLGPSISLTSMSDFVASLFIEQVLFDNGKRKAERELARADVEVAAVTLSEDSNTRVLTALELYLQAEKARARVAITRQAATDMTEFMRIMEARVAGGVSDTSDEQVLRLKLDEARETLHADLEAERTALAELSAMSAFPLDNVTGVSEVPVFPAGVQPLDVLMARAEMDRDVAETKIERAGFLPSLTAGGTTSNVRTDMGVSIETENLIGLGTGAALGAIEADKQAAAARIEQAQENSDRKIARLREYLASLDRQSANTGTLASQSVTNYRTFQEQYEAGQRQVMDVVNVYETMVSRRLEHVGLKYDAILTKLQMAEEFGLLVDGDDV